MSKPSKCDPHELCEECPEWIFTLADLIMCMMGLFVLLWVLKPEGKKQEASAALQAQDQRFIDTLGGIREGFGYEPKPDSQDPVDQSILRRRKEKQNEGKGGRTEVVPRGAQGPEHEVSSIRPGKHAIVGTRIMFGAGSAELPQGASRNLDDIVAIIQGHRQIFLVKGHTSLDDLPEGGTSDQKMGLSVRRAQAVADYLTRHGVEAEILRVEGCSTFEPVVERAYTDDKRAANRRVEVEGTDSPVAERQDTAQTTSVLPPGVKQSDAKREEADTDTASLSTEIIEKR